MTPAEFATYIRFQTKTNTTTFTDANILALANVFLYEICDGAVQANEDYFGLKFYRDLVSNQRDYSLPYNLYKMKRVEFISDPTQPTKFYKADEVDMNSFDFPMDESHITAYFTDQYPKYDVFGNSLYLLTKSAIPSLTAGLVLWGIMFPEKLTDLSSNTDMSQAPDNVSHGFPTALHELLARRVIIEYKSSKDVPIPLSEKEQMYEVDLQKKLKELRNFNMDRANRARLPYNDGSQY